MISSPCVRINCYKNIDNWPNENKDEIHNAIKINLEVEIYFNCIINY
jgi:hypothetical protein